MNEALCDCCEGTQVLTPAGVANRPGLTALAYRAGTHARFLETMKARLASIAVDVPDGEAATAPAPILSLRNLTTRAADDASIALLDSWATVADVLTFYQERIANEGYLRTATERRSVLELARLVGYALRPGVASTVYLAYTVDENQQTPVEIPVGTRAQSVPGPGELPQSFETGEVLDARAAWNTLKPRLSQPQTFKSIWPRGMLQNGTLYLKGITTNLKPNDPLLIVDGGTPDLARVVDVQIDAANDRTAIILASSQKARSVLARSGPGEPMRATESSNHAERLRAVAERYRNAADFDVDPAGRMARQVIDLLDDLRASARDDSPAPELAAVVRTRHLAQVKAELAAAGAAGYSRLQRWLNALVDDLEAAIAAVEAASNEPGTRGVRSAHSSNENGAAQDDDLLGVVRGLSIPASVPPANTLQLARDVRDTFAVNADGGLQIVNALRPDFRGNLATALANVQVADPNPLEVYALRLKTGVYGNTAPLKPVTDSQGRVVGQQEWPIDGTLTIGVTLDNFDGGPYDAEISVVEANVTRRKAIGLSESTSVRDTLGTVGFLFDPNKKFSVGNDFVVVYEDVFGRLRVTLAFQLQDDSSINLRIKIGNRQEQELQLVGGVTTAAVVHSHNFKIAYDWDQVEIPNGNEVVFAPVRLSVVDEAPLQPTPKDVIALDGIYDQIAPASWYVIGRPDGVQKIGRVADAQTVARTDYNFPAKGTQLMLNNAEDTNRQDWLTDQDLLLSDIRSTTVYAQSALLELAEQPIVTQICGGAEDEIELDGLYSDLKSGRWLIVAGDRGDIEDRQGNVVGNLKSAELVMLTRVRHGYRPDLPGDKTHTFITLAEKLAYCYQRDKVKIYGNVVKATHGETRSELLGNGDGSRAFQSFDLKQPPVTYIAAPNPSGVDNTLHVYVNDVEWHEAETLAGLAATDRTFITRTDDAGKPSVIFGNGKQGARLPTGAANVRAAYRNGIGSPGNVQAGQISLLASRPLGVKEVINPLRASGGADREGRDQARKNAPLAVAALDRLVSLQDYADFARTFAGIGKASAQRLPDKCRELVHVTIAGADDIPIDPSSDLYRNLALALRTFGDPDLPIRVETRELILLVMSAKVFLQPDYVWEPVVTRVRTRLQEAFSFDNRELGQDALLSEAITVMQATLGVAYVDVDIFDGVPEKVTDETTGERRLMTPQEITQLVEKMAPSPQPRIRVNLAMAGDTILPAQLAMFSPLVPDTLILNRG